MLEQIAGKLELALSGQRGLEAVAVQVWRLTAAAAETAAGDQQQVHLVAA